MNEYELQAYKEIEEWKQKLLKKSGMLNRLSKKAQTKVNSLIPEKAHQILTDSIKKMVKATLVGSNLTTRKKQFTGHSLKEMDKQFSEKFSSYKKTAIIEGAGTGAGGFILGLADFPLLLTIKMKFLFEAAAIYGFDTDEYEERLFLLHVFKLAFSSDEKRRATFGIVEEWDARKAEIAEMDWREFQQEYRDYIDFVKMLQLVPGIGAAVGAFANNNLMEHLGETAKNAYRMRVLKTAPKLY
ncbi:EcsC family protein [Bacillus sp. DTU_2020_1000418_1_SI_GHA_SEK_038]|uniref:EcsC family protein n=1 Tax=Bacillus sp. DTU_2020_1000418_1_SI_GHA_SEK_038 TaxID=3077585 RepID=UPI0028EDA663|nr:EcsC family protein [Bacillus sp. DTU_2020_1000418_1_SI_GHA_SEK_038]WNS76775.1 EcsC family protein [Bacillus sp. DTU_2020_1000418_1_SI_GHA_SEK_038]